MKFLKAGLAVLMACVMLTGCGKKDLTEDEMKALFQETQTNMASLESSHLALDAKLNISGSMLAQSGIDNTDMTMTLDMKYKDMNKQTMGLSGEYSIGIMGMNLTGSLYVKDEAMYIDLLGQKMKTPLDLSAFEIVEQPANIDVSMLSNWTYEQADGLTFISCDVDNDYFKSILDSLEEASGSFKVNKLNFKYGITDDKYISSVVISMDVEMTADGQSAVYAGEINITWDEHNKVSEITYPDLSNYQETEESLF